MKKISLILLLIISITSCKSTSKIRNTFVFPEPVDTHSKKIDLQEKNTFVIDDISVDNTFNAARMNGFSKLNDTLYRIIVSPENKPVNPSPWYAFKMWSEQNKKIYIQLHYTYGKHRYNPKISSDRKKWKAVNEKLLQLDSTKTNLTFPVQLSKKPIWISAQPIINSIDTRLWIEALKKHPKVQEAHSIGKSVLHRDIPFFKIKKGDAKGKKVIVLMSRQHPPETTGFLALQYFIDEMLNENRLSDDFFQKYEIWVFPLLNPDGVDLGHWRHNANGVDLNRDWAYYRQAETNAFTQFIVNEINKTKYKLVLGIDFHSTYKDIYYVFDDSFHTTLPGFSKKWADGIDRIMTPFHTKYKPEKLSKPYSKTWFYMQYKAESITYEVGDNTPENIIEKKARTAAVLMMQLLSNQQK